MDYMLTCAAQDVQGIHRGVEIKFLTLGKEVSVDSFVEVIVREVCASVRKEISRTLAGHEQQGINSSRRVNTEIPRQAVSVREAALLLSISPRSVDRYVRLKVIRTVLGLGSPALLIPGESVYSMTLYKASLLLFVAAIATASYASLKSQRP